MRKILSGIMMLVGCGMILGAIGLWSYNKLESKAAGEHAAVILTQVKAQVAPALPAKTQQEEPQEPEREMPVAEVDGASYVGTLSIPCLGLELPVMDQWSYENLKTAPCRYYGSVVTEDLVICGHSYDTHFGALASIPNGAELQFTTMDGRVYTYQAAFVEQLEASEIAQMNAGEYPLTLFSCTRDGQKRVTLRCSMLP